MQMQAAPDSAVLYGRDVELERLDDLLAGARDARSGVLVVRGQAGVGKSALLERAAGHAPDMRLLVCRGTESEQHLAFAALHQLLRPVLYAADRLPEVQERALRGALGMAPSAGPARFLVGLAVLGLLAETAAETPVLCVVDDAHWLDEASADMLLFAARRLGAERVAVLFAARDDDDGGFEATGLPELALAGLAPADARALVNDATGGRLSDEVADELLRATGGHPLALLELAGALTEAQGAGDEPILAPLPLSASVERSFLRRVRRLPDEAQRLLLVAAADDSGDLTTVLHAATRLGIAPAALDDAERAGLVRARGLQLRLRHPLVRSAVYHGAPASQRLAAHRALAEVLAGEEHADRRAWHRAAATVAPDPAVVDELEQTARRARDRGAYDAAARAFERAAGLASDDEERARLLVAAAESAWLPGDVARAQALLRRARPLSSRPVLRANADRLAGVIELTTGTPAEACRILSRAAASVAGPDPDRALHLLTLASWAAAIGRDAPSIVAAADAAGRLRLADTPANRFFLRRLAGLRAHFTGEFGEAATMLRTTLEAIDADDAAEHFTLASPVGLFLCDDRPVLALHERVAARARETGAVALLAQTLPWLALGDLWSGRWPSAEALLAEGLELARGTGQHQVEAHLIALSGMLAALRGDEERCRALAAQALEHAVGRGLVHVICCATWALTVLELGLGRPEAAVAHARALPSTASVEWDALDRVEAAFRIGDTALTQEWLDAFEPWAESSEAPWGRAVALHGRALLASDADEAERLFTASLEIHDEAARPFERARTELAFGEALRRARRRTDARAHLRAALNRFEALGARAWAERARTELRASGESSRRRDPSTLDDLTAQELQIAHLVAEGNTNREVAGRLFLSPRTIDFHLRNIFRKLGITSRTELARWVSEAA